MFGSVLAPSQIERTPDDMENTTNFNQIANYYELHPNQLKYLAVRLKLTEKHLLASLKSMSLPSTLDVRLSTAVTL